MHWMILVAGFMLAIGMGIGAVVQWSVMKDSYRQGYDAGLDAGRQRREDYHDVPLGFYDEWVEQQWAD